MADDLPTHVDEYLSECSCHPTRSWMPQFRPAWMPACPRSRSRRRRASSSTSSRRSRARSGSSRSGRWPATARSGSAGHFRPMVGSSAWSWTLATPRLPGRICGGLGSTRSQKCASARPSIRWRH